jgi:hypothetical protein
MKFIRVKTTKRYSGGGGSTQTTESIPAWAQPYVQNVMGKSQDLYNSGELSKVAGASGLQEQAFTTGAGDITSTTASGLNTLSDQQARLTEAATSGGYDTSALKDKAILEAGQATANLGSTYGGAGTLGSARQAVQQGAQDAATAAQFATIDQNAEQQNFTNKMAAEAGLGSSVGAGANLATGQAAALGALGEKERAITQQEADASWQGLQRYGSTVYGTPAKQSQTSGGK